MKSGRPTRFQVPLQLEAPSSFPWTFPWSRHRSFRTGLLRDFSTSGSCQWTSGASNHLGRHLKEVYSGLFYASAASLFSSKQLILRPQHSSLFYSRSSRTPGRICRRSVSLYALIARWWWTWWWYGQKICWLFFQFHLYCPSRKPAAAHLKVWREYWNSKWWTERRSWWIR